MVPLHASSASLTTFVCLSIIYIIYHIILYPLLLHPLRRIPRAHWSVAFPYIGPTWILYQRYCRRNNVTTYNAHLRGGPVVRLGYNELSVNCVDNGIRTIYGGGWEKHEWYARQFAGYGVINMFSTVHNGPHSQKKRTISNIYARSSLQTSSQIKQNSHEIIGRRFLPLIQSFSESGDAIDIHELNNGFTMDFMSAYMFGIGRSSNFIQDAAFRKTFMHTYHSRRDYEWHSAEVSPILRRWMKSLGVSFVPKFVDTANEYLEDWNTKMCEGAEQYLKEHPNGPDEDHLGDEPMVYKHFKVGTEKLRLKDPNAGREILPHLMDPTPFYTAPNGLELMSRAELYSDMYDQLSAGHETSAIGLTYLYWELSRLPELQNRLWRELQNLQPQIKWPPRTDNPSLTFELPDPGSVDQLPFLDALITETLRLHAPIPGNEPRVSPHVPGGSTLGSFEGIPGGVRVSAMPYTLHRNTEVFPRPDSFDPDRWLIDDDQKLKEMHRWFWAFGSGGRMCIGRHLAVQEMKLVVAAIYTNWKTEIVDDDGIDELDVYTTRPRSNKLMLRFIHR